MKRDLPTVCVLCSHNCGLRVDVDDNRVVAVRPDPDNPVSRGYSCNKAFSIAHYIEHAQRVQTPLRRRDDGTFEPVGAVRRDAAMRPGHLAIPNGSGLEFPDRESGALKRTGVSINELTDAMERDPFTGSPHHKFVRCRLVPVSSSEA